MKLRDLKIGTKITLTFMLVGILIPVIGGSIVYNRLRALLEEQIYAHLETTVISRKNHIQTFLRQKNTEEIRSQLAAGKEIPELNEIVRDRTGLRETGEIYLIDNNCFMITPSRFTKGTFLKQKVDTLNARNALSTREHPGKHVGHITVGGFPDYRGVFVLGTHAYVPEMEWGLLAEIDQVEALLPLRILRNTILSIILIIPVLASLLGFYFSRRISKPIDELRKAAVEMGEGKLGVRAEIKTKDEIGILAGSFNKMSAALKEIFARSAAASKEMIEVVMRVGRGDYSAHVAISEKNDDFDSLGMGINMMIDDLKSGAKKEKAAKEEMRLSQLATLNMMEDLQEEKEKVDELMRIKSDFTSMVSHEMRTPLTAIKEGIGIVQDGTTGKVNADQNEFLGIAKRNVDRLHRLINDVLDFSKLEAKRLEFKMQTGVILDTIREAVNAEKKVAEEKGLYMKTEFVAGIPKISYDEDRIMQVMTNFLSNAIKFTEKGGITVSVGRENGQIKVCVADTGPGVAKEDIPKLFHKFQQLGGASGRKTGGTGLGLAICKQIIEQHKGRVWVESELGKGSQFCFSLPI
ncbi:ATP-binding protein [Candidatus Margulisiibacteriota bacterium]